MQRFCLIAGAGKNQKEKKQAFKKRVKDLSITEKYYLTMADKTVDLERKWRELGICLEEL